MSVPLLKNKLPKFRTKSAGAEPLGVLSNSVAIEFSPAKLEFLNGLDDRFAGLFVEEQAGLAVDHRLGRSTPAERNDRRPAGLRFDRSNSESSSAAMKARARMR